MKESMSNIGNLFALSHDPVVCVENGRISYMNPPASALFGRDLLGLPETALLPEHILSIVSESFVASANVRGHLLTVSRCTVMDQRLYSFILPTSGQGQTDAMAVSSTMRELTNSIKATSDLITIFSQKYEDRSLSQYSALLRHSSAKMLRLVNNYALFSMFQQGNPIFNPIMTSVGKICRDICEELKSYTAARDISVTYTETQDIISSVDQSLLSQMILNLLSNSLNHVKKGGNIHLELSGTKTHILISVTDDGCGIPADVLVNVFRAYSNTVDLTSGAFAAGLGLSVADAVAKLHGGTLIIESRENQGTKVIVQFPRVITNELMSPRATYPIPAHELVMTNLSTWLTWEDYLPEE